MAKGLLTESHPVWVCGLKPFTNENLKVVEGSHPVWVCGLKLLSYGLALKGVVVTPCMGVWIETQMNTLQIAPELCHTLYGCVD